MFKTVKIDDAVGLVLAYHVTEIRPGVFKGPAFKKGHRIHRRDIWHLQRLGKQPIFVLELERGARAMRTRPRHPRPPPFAALWWAGQARPGKAG